jgi:hypothetical protein
MISHTLMTRDALMDLCRLYIGARHDEASVKLVDDSLVRMVSQAKEKIHNHDAANLLDRFMSARKTASNRLLLDIIEQLDRTAWDVYPCTNVIGFRISD